MTAEVTVCLHALGRPRSSLRGREGYMSTTVIFVLIEDSDCMEEMVGKRFGKLVIIEFEKRSPNVLSRCTCRCDCGNTIEIVRTALVL